MSWRTYRLALQLDLANGMDSGYSIEGLTLGNLKCSIEISTHEYCDDKNRVPLQGNPISVYSPRMIALEKLRAICQHMPDYAHCCTTRPRSRDFYDIYCLIANAGVSLTDADTIQVARQVFALREVPFGFLRRISKYRDLHSADWQTVQAAVHEPLHPFDFYFDYVCEQVELAKTRWDLVLSEPRLARRMSTAI